METLPRRNELELANRREIARLLGVSCRTVDSLCAQGLPHLLLGTRTARFNPAEVLAWCQRERGVRRNGTRRSVATNTK
jgi:hypothetical protein